MILNEYKYFNRVYYHKKGKSFAYFEQPLKKGLFRETTTLLFNVGIDDLDPKLQIRASFVSKLKCAPIFMKFGNQDTFDMLIIYT